MSEKQQVCRMPGCDYLLIFAMKLTIYFLSGVMALLVEAMEAEEQRER